MSTASCAADFVLKNKLWESSLHIKRQDIEDDEWGAYDIAMPELADEAAYHPDELWLSALEAADATLAWDGQYFFDTDHSWGESGTQDNDLTDNIVAPTDPTVAEFKAALKRMTNQMLGFKRDNGKPYFRPVIGKPQSLLVFVPIGFRQVAAEAIQSIVLSNSTNVVIDDYKIVTGAGLTNADRFWLMNVSTRLKPFVFQARKPLTRLMKGMTDIEFKNVKFMTEARYNLGYLAWWNAVQMIFT